MVIVTEIDIAQQQLLWLAVCTPDRLPVVTFCEGWQLQRQGGAIADAATDEARAGFEAAAEWAAGQPVN